MKHSLINLTAVRIGLKPGGPIDALLDAIAARDAEAKRLMDEVINAYDAWFASWFPHSLPPICPSATDVVVLAPNREASARLRRADEALESYLSSHYSFDPASLN